VIRLPPEARDTSPFQTFKRLWGLRSFLSTTGVSYPKLKRSEHKADNNSSNFKSKNK